MPVGDVVAVHQSVAAGSFLLIQPAAGVEWVVQNYWSGGSVELYVSDGTTDTLIETATGAAGNVQGQAWPVNNAVFMKLKNVTAGAVYVGYNGRVTK